MTLKRNQFNLIPASILTRRRKDSALIPRLSCILICILIMNVFSRGQFRQQQKALHNLFMHHTPSSGNNIGHNHAKSYSFSKRYTESKITHFLPLWTILTYLVLGLRRPIWQASEGLPEAAITCYLLLAQPHQNTREPCATHLTDDDEDED